MASAKINRPSASVLSTSMVLPFIARMMSPGRCAVPDGMFSTAGTTPKTLMRGATAAMAFIAPMTAAPPLMSPFISHMLADGLIEMPPESNVMPFPTMATLFSGCSGSPRCSMMMSRGSLMLPAVTASIAPMPCSIMSSRPRTVIERPASFAISVATSAMRTGLTTFAGSFTRSRASAAHSASSLPLCDALLQCLRAMFVALHDDDLVERPVGIARVALLVALELVEAKERALCHRLRRVVRIEAADTRAVSDRGRATDSAPAQRSRDCTGDRAHRVDVELLALAEPRDDDALGG